MDIITTKSKTHFQRCHTLFFSKPSKMVQLIITNRVIFMEITKKFKICCSNFNIKEYLNITLKEKVDLE
jgi:hypothetical protein